MRVGKYSKRARTCFVVFGLAAGVSIIAWGAQARTWLVPSECPTIPLGLDSAEPGDTVLVAPGTYVTSDFIPGTYVSLSPGVTLLGEGGRDVTTLEICNGLHGINLVDCEGARVSGFTVRQVFNDTCGPPMSPSYGFTCEDCTDIIIEDCALEGVSYGILISGASEAARKPVIRNNVFRDCSRGVACYDVYESASPFVQDNTMTGCFYGAEIKNSSPDFDANLITSCHDGLYYWGHCGGDCTNNVIAHNEECGAYVWSDPPIASPCFNGGSWLEEANSIYENGTWDIWYAHTGLDALIMAQLNFWGSNCPDFAGKIHGRVDHTPWVDSTHTVVLREDDCPQATRPSTWGDIKAKFE
jgi:hypothetical protein